MQPMTFVRVAARWDIIRRVSGSGSVSSLPSGINDCAQAADVHCDFRRGGSVVLTATSVPTWQNCPSGVETNTCVVTIATGVLPWRYF